MSLEGSRTSRERGNRRRGASLSVRVAVTAALIIVLSNAASIVVQFNGFRLLGYRGRNQATRTEAIRRIAGAAESKRNRMTNWFAERAKDARIIAEQVSRGWPTEALIEAARRGWPPGLSPMADRSGSALAAMIRPNPAVVQALVVEAGSGRVLADSLEPPFNRVEEVAWLGPGLSMRTDAAARCVLGYAFPDGHGRNLAVLLYLRLPTLFNQIRIDSYDPALDLEIAILDADYHVLRSSDPVRYLTGVAPLSTRALDEIGTGAVRETRGRRGESVLAGIFDAGMSGDPGIKLFISSRLATVEATMSADRAAAVDAALATTAAGLLLIWLLLRRLFLPLAGLEAAIAAFARGEGRRPLPGKLHGDIALLAEATGTMMDSVSDWRRTLETQVADRTAELRIHTDVATLFANVEDDERAYTELAGLLGRAMSAEGVLLVWLGLGPAKAHFYPGGAPPRLDEAGLNSLLSSIAAPQLPFEALGLRYAHHHGRRLEISAAVEALIVILGDEALPQPKVEALDHLLVELAPLLRSRVERRRQEAHRLEAERSLRRSEERLRTFFEESRDMIYTSNAEDVVASMNSAGLKLLGYTDRFAIVGRPFSLFALNREDREHFLDLIREQGFVSDYEIVLKRANGETVFCLEAAQAVKDREGRIIEIQGIIKDISERISAERELWRANMELAEANSRLKETQMLMVQHEKLASIGQLAAGVAHEINNPLGFLKSNHGVLARYFETVRKAWLEAADHAPEPLRAIAEAGDLDYVFREIDSIFLESDEGYRRIMEIVSNLKSFARSESETAISAYDLNKGIESTLTVARNEVKYVAEVDLSLGELPTIEAAGGQLNQVILNLLVNSAQAIAGQKRQTIGHIRIATGRVEDRVFCSVSDDGPGIPEELRLKIFDPFFTTKEPGKGTGLGLSISYDIIVSKHGGRFFVDHSPEGGARFRFELPLVHAEGEPPALSVLRDASLGT